MGIIYKQNLGMWQALSDRDGRLLGFSRNKSEAQNYVDRDREQTSGMPTSEEFAESQGLSIKDYGIVLPELTEKEIRDMRLAQIRRDSRLTAQRNLDYNVTRRMKAKIQNGMHQWLLANDPGYRQSYESIHKAGTDWGLLPIGVGLVIGAAAAALTGGTGLSLLAGGITGMSKGLQYAGANPKIQLTIGNLLSEANAGDYLKPLMESVDVGGLINTFAKAVDVPEFIQDIEQLDIMSTARAQVDELKSAFGAAVQIPPELGFQMLQIVDIESKVRQKVEGYAEMLGSIDAIALIKKTIGLTPRQPITSTDIRYAADKLIEQTEKLKAAQEKEEEEKEKRGIAIEKKVIPLQKSAYKNDPPLTWWQKFVFFLKKDFPQDFLL